MQALLGSRAPEVYTLTCTGLLQSLPTLVQVLGGLRAHV